MMGIPIADGMTKNASCQENLAFTTASWLTILVLGRLEFPDIWESPPIPQYCIILDPQQPDFDFLAYTKV